MPRPGGPSLHEAVKVISGYWALLSSHWAPQAPRHPRPSTSWDQLEILPIVRKCPNRCEWMWASCLFGGVITIRLWLSQIPIRDKTTSPRATTIPGAIAYIISLARCPRSALIPELQTSLNKRSSSYHCKNKTGGNR
jgi:hypothetical protein